MDWYDHESIEKKWQERWEKEQSNRAEDFLDKPKAFVLVEFPYPSGDGLHVGHVRSYSALDAVARKLRLEGRNVLFPIGWDAFGLPTENYALKTGIHPRTATDTNISTFRRQMKALGLSFDWSREVDTTDPAYYRWTQWIFLQLLKQGLAYQATMAINWCPKDKIGLANEEVVGGACERCGTPVTRKMQKQWMLKITAYADRLLQDLGTVDYLERIKTQQTNWIGRSEGAEIAFQIESGGELKRSGKLKSEEGKGKSEERKGESGKLKNGGLQKVLVATNNPSKVERIRKLLQSVLPDVQLVTPQEAGLSAADIEEGNDLLANARAKALAYRSKTDLPVLGNDTGVFITGEDHDPAQVKRNALGGIDDPAMPQEEKAKHMVAFYAAIAKRHGGKAPGYWKDVFVLLLPDGTERISESRRDIIFTTTVQQPVDPYFPMRSLYVNVATGKYAAEQTEDEEINIDLAPYKQALADVLRPSIAVFTTRPDTLFGATYLVVAPEHAIVQSSKFQVTNSKEVQAYIEKAAKKSDLDRTDLAKDKTGVELKGLKAVNPINQQEIPIWVADYVLSTYGTGAIMAVPAHDERDWEFAQRYKLPVTSVLRPTLVGNCVMIHGCPTHPEDDPEKRTYDKHWMPWLEQQLEGMGVRVTRPIMPMPWAPKYEEWKEVMDRQEVDENTILIGHSCGTSFLARWLGETKKSARALMLVAPWKIPDASVPPEFVQAKKDFYSYPIDPEIKNRVATIVMFTADDEDDDGKKSLELYHQILGGRVISLAGRGHYIHEDMGTDEFPELRDVIREIISFSPAKISPIPMYERVVGAAAGVVSPKEVPSLYTGEGVMVHSGPYSGKQSQEGGQVIVADLQQRGLGKPAVQYRLRDWVFSRQHYWGEPIPIIHCPEHGAVPVPDDQLPVELPYVEKYQPTGTGESPLASISEWVNTPCPTCGKPAKRETDTMPNWAGSSWYFLRYCDPKNTKSFADRKKLAYWMPVDLYNGGMEHTVLHLLYSRFWHKFLYDQGLVPQSEPYQHRHSHGIVLGEDGRKMSKSFGNVVNPDDLVREYGADSLRLYEMFMGPFEDMIPWSTRGIVGVHRFLDRVCKVLSGIAEQKDRLRDVPGMSKAIHKTVKKVTDDINAFRFNTVVSTLMEFFNQRDFAPKLNAQGEFEGGSVDFDAIKKFLLLLSPSAPHLAAELWERLFAGDITTTPWPTYDQSMLRESTITLIVQVNGRVRAKISAPVDTQQDAAVELALAQENVKKFIKGKPRQVIFVSGRLINLIG